MPSGDCLWLVRPDLGVHQENSCLHVVASSMHDGCADYTTRDACRIAVRRLFVSGTRVSAPWANAASPRH